MKFPGFVSLLIVFAALFGASNSVSASAKNYVEGELLVKFKYGTASPESLAAAAVSDAEIVQQFPELGLQLVKLPAGISTEKGLAQFGNLAGVEYVQPNYIYNLAATPNDASFSQLYAMQKISAPAAWDITTGSSQIVVAVIDTGIKYTHEDLAANMWRNAGEIAGNNVDDDGNGFVDDYYGYDFFYNDSDPMDEHGHGTHIAGTVGAVGNNSVGVAGVNWNVRLMAIKIYNNTGFGSTSAMLIRAYNYVRMMRNRGVNIRVTNNSYSGCDEACNYDQATKDALDALGEANVLNVFAAGNDSRNIENAPVYPASYNNPGILAVAASDAADARAGFSNFGSTSVDLAAPGVGILSTTLNASDATYGTASGTSAAAPHVAGAAALLAAANPNLSAASLKASLMNSVDQLAQWNGVVKTGGRLNAAKALQQPTACSFTLDSTSVQVQAAGSFNFFTVDAARNCDFSVSSQASWITVNRTVGSGFTGITYTVAPNSGAPRQGIIRAAGQNHVVFQEGTTAAPNRAILDFDGDGRTDFSALQNSGGQMIWHNRNSTNGYNAVNFGLFTDSAVPADYDGDGKTDVAVWRAGAQAYFYVLKSSDNTLQAFQWGTNGDNPNVAQDFDGDQKADFAVTRRTNGEIFWYVRHSSNGAFVSRQFGLNQDTPLRGDFDGDQKADFAVYRSAAGNPANTFIVLKSSNNAVNGFNFGDSAIDKPVPGDFDGDGKTDFAVYRTTNGTWYLQQTAGGFRAFQFGNGTTDLPAPGDYDGDGKTDAAVWRPNSSASESAQFYVSGSAAGFSAVGWGQSGMRIPANAFQIGN